MNIEVKKAIGGGFWDVMIGGVRIERFWTRKDAVKASKYYSETYRRVRG